MAYATKYLFKWESSNGTTREIQVQKDGYSGSVIQRRLGRAPVLKKQRNGTVFGTSLEFYAECAVDGEFAEFYTSDPKAYKVLLYTGATLLWQGYVTPELYSEPDIAPPYDVQVIATDGIGELKLYDFAAQGVKTLRQMFTYLLGYTGLGTDVYLISSMKAGSSGAGALLDKTINLDYKVGDTCYEVLTYLLDTLHATITWWRGAWIVARETNVTFSSSKVRYYNTSGNSALLTGSVVTLGKMYTSDAWPVGQLTQKIDPAKKSVTIQAPWHVNDAFVNGPMATDTGWTKTNNASWNSTKKGYNLPDNGQTTNLATVSQSISMLGMRVPMDFVGKFCASLISGQMYNGVAGVAVDYVTSGNVTYHLGKDSEGNPTWVSGSSGNTDYDFQIRLTAVDTDDANAEALSFTIPALAVGTSYPAGTLTVRIVGRSAIVFSASLDVVITKGYQDRLHIDNGARGEEGTVEIAIGRETSDIDYYKAFMQGLLLDSGSLITSFKDDNLTTATDFLSYISRDYARSFALPRIVRTGKVYLEDGVSYPPLVLSKGAVDYWLETFSWDMYEDELDISARSLPTATITVESEVIAEYGTGTASSSSSSGGGATPITPIPSVLPNPYALTFGNKSYDGSEPVTLTASDIGALTGITAAMVNAAYGFTISGTAGSTYNLGNLHTHSNKSVLDDITANNVNDWNAAALVAHSHSNKSVLDGITSSLVTNWNTAYTNNHTHSNKSLLDSMTINWDNYFGIDSDGNVYVKKDGDNPRHFYSYGAVSAGGLSTGGGTGGIDLQAMWASLQNNDIGTSGPAYEHRNDKIHTWHLPACGTGLSYTTDSAGLATGINVSFPVTSVAGKTGAVTLAFSDITGTASTAQIPDLSGTYLPKAGGTMAGNISLSDNVAIEWSPTFTDYIRMPFRIKDGTHYTGINLFDSGGQVYTKLGVFTNQYGEGNDGNSIFLYPNDGPKIGTNYIWHAGNLTKSVLTGLLDASGGYYLPLTGGTIDSTSFGALCIKRGASVGNSTSIKFQDGNTISGYLGFQYDNGNYRPGYWDSATDFKYFYHSGNFNPGNYLPLTGGTISKASVVPLTINATSGVQSAIAFQLDGTDASQVGHADNNIGTWLYDYTSQAYINITHTGELKYKNTNSIYHSGNANRTTVPWACSTLDAATSVSAPRFADANNRDVLLSNPDAANPYMIFGYGNMASGATTYIDGNTIRFRCGTSYYNVLTITNDGVFSFENSSAKWPFQIITEYAADNSQTTVYAGYPSGYGLYVGTSADGIGTPIFNVESGEAGHGTGGTSRFVVCANGRVGVNNVYPQYEHDVTGVIHASTGILSDGYITAGSASSREFKDNVQNMSLEYARNIIMSSRPITFQWNALAHSLCDKYEGDGIGFIAQEAEQLMPFAVSSIFEKYKRLDYTAYISPLVRVAQSHEMRIRELEDEVGKLREENQQLKARLTN